jgi:hypothetical protein
MYVSVPASAVSVVVAMTFETRLHVLDDDMNVNAVQLVFERQFAEQPGTLLVSTYAPPSMVSAVTGTVLLVLLLKIWALGVYSDDAYKYTTLDPAWTKSRLDTK